jgi:hypothetical protein
MDTPTAKEGVSLATSRWCRSRDCRRRATLGSLLLSFPLHLLLPLAFATVVGGQGRGGEGPPEDSAVPAEVGVAVAAVEGTLLLRA